HPHSSLLPYTTLFRSSDSSFNGNNHGMNGVVGFKVFIELRHETEKRINLFIFRKREKHTAVRTASFRWKPTGIHHKGRRSIFKPFNIGTAKALNICFFEKLQHVFLKFVYNGYN